MPTRPPTHRVDILRDQQTGKEMVVPSVDLSDTVQGSITKRKRKRIRIVFIYFFVRIFQH